MHNPVHGRQRIPELLEVSVLDTLESALVTAMTTLAEIYPLPAEMLISTGEYTALHAHSDTVATQSRALHEALRLYRKCLEELPAEPPIDHDDDHDDIRF